MKVRFAVLAASCVFSGAALAAPLGEPSLTAGQNIKVETGEITLPAIVDPPGPNTPTTYTVVRYTWRDSGGNPRSVSLLPAAGTTGYAVQMSFQVFGPTRNVYLNASPNGDGGFGYFVSHELYRQFVGGGEGTIAGLHVEDDSPLGRYLASTGTASSVAQNQAVHEYRLNYPRWGTVATIEFPDGVAVSPNFADHQKFLLPVVIRWSFVSGQDYPLWSVDYDLTSASDHISTDVRGPYGVMLFNESINGNVIPWVTSTRWGDKYTFFADTGGVDFGTLATPPANMAWTWNALNAGRRYNTLGAVTYEFGIVDTVKWDNSPYGDGYSEFRSKTSANTASCGYGMRSMPCDSHWGYQSFQYDYGPPSRPKLAWGSSPYLGTSYNEVYNGLEQIPFSGKGHIHYGVHIVFGRNTFGSPLAVARAAMAQEPNRTLTVASSPPQGGSVSYSVLGDATNPHVDAGRILAAWSSVSFIATPAPGFAFSAWTGGCAGAAGPTCIVTMDAAKTVTATFTGAALSVRGDVNADGKADLFWRNNAPGTGLSWWTMNGSTVTGSNFYDVGSEWQIMDVGDLNGDGKADLVWRRSTDGAAYLWTLNGLTPAGFFDLGILSPAVWTLVGSADFSGDHKSDLLWRNTDGTLYGWIMNAGSITSQGVIGNPGSPWVVIDMADMDGDGKADIVFRNANTGQVYIWFMNGLAVTGAGSPGTLDPAVWTLLGAGDFTGDGKADLLWRSNTGDVYVWTMNGVTVTGAPFVTNLSLPWSFQAIADFNGDGKADIVWRHTDGSVYYWQMNGGVIAAGGPVPNPGATWRIVSP